MSDRVIVPAVWYETTEVLTLLGGITKRDLRRLPIPRTPVKRGKDLYLGSDLLAWLQARGRTRLRKTPGPGRVVRG